MYIKQYLEFTAKMYNISNINEKVNEVILKTDITKEKHKKIKELSKGYKQRVGLAAALIHNPEILILDEPTTGLDPNQLIDIRKLIKEIGKNKTVLFSTHILNEVEKICDRVIVINNGNLIEDKPIKYFKTNNIALENHFQKLTT
jgi:ABC-2 type transport system ATP-binding protein